MEQNKLQSTIPAKPPYPWRVPGVRTVPTPAAEAAGIPNTEASLPADLGEAQ